MQKSACNAPAPGQHSPRRAQRPQPEPNETMSQAKKRIRIETSFSPLKKYRHAASLFAARALLSALRKAENLGLDVIDARSPRHSVPNAYYRAWTMWAPFYAYDASTREIRLVQGRLETRSHARPIPGHIIVAGAQPTPEGWRCLSRTEQSTDFVF